MIEANLLSLIAAPILFLGFVFQLITLNHEGLQEKQLAKMGKRIMAAGFLVAALRLWFLPLFPIPLGILAFLLLAIGSLFMNFERVIDTCAEMREREDSKCCKDVITGK